MNAAWANIVGGWFAAPIPMQGRNGSWYTLTTGEQTSPKMASEDDRNIHSLDPKLLAKRLAWGVRQPEELWCKPMKKSRAKERATATN